MVIGEDKMRVSDAWGKIPYSLSFMQFTGYGSCYLREPDARFTKNYIGEYTILTDAHTCAQKTHSHSLKRGNHEVTIK